MLQFIGFMLMVLLVNIGFIALIGVFVAACYLALYVVGVAVSVLISAVCAALGVSTFRAAYSRCYGRMTGLLDDFSRPLPSSVDRWYLESSGCDYDYDRYAS